jgi:hypothetical protein
MELKINGAELQLSADNSIFFDPDMSVCGGSEDGVYCEGQALTPQLRQACVKLRADINGLLLAYLEDNKADINRVKNVYDEEGNFYSPIL